MTGNRPAYEKLRQQMLVQFGGTSDPPTADRMAKACMILAPPQTSMPTLARMADTAIGVGPTDANYVYYELVKALAEFRSSNFAAASDWARKVIDQGGELPRTVSAYAVLAMGQSQQHLAEQARATFAAGQELTDQKLQSYRGVNWHDRIIAQILMAEAKGLIQPDTNSAKAKNE
jgi:hypothetical protein